MSLLKELGSLQVKILKYLAENPKQHKQNIQNGIGHPSSQYGSISKAVDSLEKMGYIESEKGLSKKQVEISLYSCTEVGAWYALSKIPNIETLKVLDNYKEKYSAFDFFRKEHDRMPHELFTKYWNVMMQSTPLLEKSGKEAVNQMMYLIMSMLNQFTLEESAELIKQTIEYFPESKKMIDKLDLLQKLIKKDAEEKKDD